MKLDKKLVDELIRTTKKYYRTGDGDLFPAIRHIEEQLVRNIKREFYHTLELIKDLAKYTQRRSRTCQDIYKALAIFGIEVVELEK